MRSVLVAVFLFLALPAYAADTVETGAIGSPSGSLWPIYIGESKGFFATAGVDIDLIFAPSTSGVIQQLAAGSLDIGGEHRPAGADQRHR